MRKEVLKAGNGFAIRPKLTSINEIPRLVGLVEGIPIFFPHKRGWSWLMAGKSATCFEKSSLMS
ncbi:hypothetical protein CMI37_29140 [Candidatus Pacearchaeota archaeon]|nr:hypothetical protein [Candidatus Pacearchaeota archaeon]